MLETSVAMIMGVVIGALATVAATLFTGGARISGQRLVFIILAVATVVLGLVIATGGGALVLNSNTTLLLMILAAQLLTIAKVS